MKLPASLGDFSGPTLEFTRQRVENLSTYYNSLPYLYRAVLLGSFIRNGPFDLWQSLPEYLRASEERTRFRAVHVVSLKIIDAWK